MKRQELKRVLKPIIKECVQELLLKEGLLSNIVSEVVTGMNNVITESKPQKKPQQSDPAIAKRKISEARRRMADAIGKGAYGGVNLFEGTEPLSSAGSPANDAQPTSPLANVSPNDPGVDISSLFGSMGAVWNKLK